MRIRLKTFAPASVSRAVTIRNVLLAMSVVLILVTLVTTVMNATLPSFLVIVMWAGLPVGLLMAWACHESSARITWFQFALTLLIGALVATLLAWFVEEHVRLWIDQRFSQAQTLLSIPWSSLLYYCLCTPIIEEACKALGVLVFWRRLYAANTAVLLGVVSGCGFAAFEMGLSLFGQGNWASVALSRMAVVVVHAVATGVVGWGLSLLRRKTLAQRVMAGGLLATAIGIHAVFNFMNIMSIALQLTQPIIVLGVPLTAIFLLNLGFACILITTMRMVLSITS